MTNLIFLQAKTVHLWDLLFGNPGRITGSAFDSIKVEVFVAGFLLAVLFLALAVLVSRAIPIEAGRNPKDATKRRVVFFVFGFLAILSLFFISTFSVSEKMSGIQQREFQQTSYIAIALNALVYFVGGFILSKAFSRTKLGTWFPKRES